MASVSTSHLILFIASLLIAASVAGTFTEGVQRLSLALDDKSLDVAQDVRTDVEIISDSGSPDAIYNESGGNGDGAITVLVKNTGSQRLAPDTGQLDVLVDGRYQVGVSFEVKGGEFWRPGNVVEVTIALSDPLAPGDHRVTVIANNDQEVLEFRI